MRKKIRKFLNLMLLSLTGRNYYLTRIIIVNRIKRLTQKKAENKFLFILSPNYCGSTLLTELISSSSNVSLNNKIGGTKEGQKLPEVINIMNVKERFDEAVHFDWPFIKHKWLRYWDVTLPILLEKSPPNIVRAGEIFRHFIPSYFIIFFRNPYVHCESLIRRDKVSATQAAKFAINCLKFQKQNIENLENQLVLSYEELCDYPRSSADKLIRFLPELCDLDVSKEFRSHNFKKKNMKINNLNHEKLSMLSKAQINEINVIFYNEKELIIFFNYELIPSTLE